MSEETRRYLKPLETRPEIIHGSCQVHEKCVDGCLFFIRILSALQKPRYKLALFLGPILESLTTNIYTVKYLFNFTTENVDQLHLY